MEEHNNKNINRRDFLKIVGISAATTTAAATLYSCKQKDGTIPEVAHLLRCLPIR